MKRILLILLFASLMQAQDSATVPDVIGMTMPVAAAELNRTGIAIGQEIGQRAACPVAQPERLTLCIMPR